MSSIVSTGKHDPIEQIFKHDPMKWFETSGSADAFKGTLTDSDHHILTSNIPYFEIIQIFPSALDRQWLSLF